MSLLIACVSFSTASHNTEHAADLRPGRGHHDERGPGELDSDRCMDRRSRLVCRSRRSQLRQECGPSSDPRNAKSEEPTRTAHVR